jgi:glyoxylase-like metal-dependent hydrolase (beta-lactamase superfamily II)
MLHIEVFTFNPFQENTYIIYHDNGDAFIIDPGCYAPLEKQALSAFIEERKLKPIRLINTHCHIDHVLGNPYVHRQYGLLPEFHTMELPLLQAVESYGQMWGIHSENQPVPTKFLSEEDNLTLGDEKLELVFTPGHSPGELSIVSHKQRFVIAGDVLFKESIGRTDLPGGNMDTLLKSIREKLLCLPDDYIVYSGHGPSTTIGHEKRYNPFLMA